jgi:hypothetical protein
MSLGKEFQDLGASAGYAWRLLTQPAAARLPGDIVQRNALRLLAFLAGALLLAFAVQALIHTGLRRITTSDFGITNQVVDGRAGAEIIVSGSSRALTHYDAALIGQVTKRSVLNLGLNGTQTDVQVAYLKLHLRLNAKPALVIHNLDPYAFLTSHEIYDPAKYMPYLDQPEIFSAVLRVYPQAWKWRYLPLYGYAVEDLRFTWLAGAKALLGVQPRQDRVLGYQARHTPWTGDFDKFKASHPDGVKLGIEPQGLRDVAAIAEVCRQHGVPLLFVFSPEYAGMQEIARNRAEVFGHFRAISAQGGAEFWDYSASPICRERELFYNSQHLNVRGATAFSQDLALRLAQSPLLAKPRAARAE